MNYKHPNLFVMIPYEERNRVSGYLLPYNGDTGDRLYGVRENEYVI